MQTPLAWKNLTSSYAKCVLAATGVGFAVVLMFMQIGFRNALIDNNIQIFTLFDTERANLAIVSQARYNISTEQRFPRSVLEAAASTAGVRDTCAISVERGTASVQVPGFPARPIRAIGIQLDNGNFFRQPEIYKALAGTSGTRSALADSRSKREYGFNRDRGTITEQTVELNDQALHIKGEFQLGTDFGNDGSLLMSEATLGQYFPWRKPFGNPSDVVDFALLEVAPDADLDQVAAQIQALAPKQIEVWATRDLIQREKRFWATATPIGKIFLIGTIMGLVVGAIICYQIQFTDITEHMPEFATLKAMGYGPGYFWSVILSQSLYLACLGFVPGLLVSWGLYQLLAQVSGLIMTMTLGRIALVLVLTIGMCAISGSIAIRKLFSSDPASLF